MASRPPGPVPATTPEALRSAYRVVEAPLRATAVPVSQPGAAPRVVTVENVASTARKASPVGWHVAFTDAMGDLGRVAGGVFCPCFLYGQTKHRIRREELGVDPTDMTEFHPCNADCCKFFSMALFFPYCGSMLCTGLQTRDVRRRYGIRGHCCDDFSKSFLWPWSLAQNDLEVAHRQFEERAVATQPPVQERMNYPSAPRSKLSRSAPSELAPLPTIPPTALVPAPPASYVMPGPATMLGDIKTAKPQKTGNVPLVKKAEARQKQLEKIRAIPQQLREKRAGEASSRKLGNVQACSLAAAGPAAQPGEEIPLQPVPQRPRAAPAERLEILTTGLPSANVAVNSFLTPGEPSHERKGQAAPPHRGNEEAADYPARDYHDSKLPADTVWPSHRELEHDFRLQAERARHTHQDKQLLSDSHPHQSHGRQEQRGSVSDEPVHELEHDRARAGPHPRHDQHKPIDLSTEHGPQPVRPMRVSAEPEPAPEQPRIEVHSPATDDPSQQSVTVPADNADTLKPPEIKRTKSTSSQSTSFLNMLRHPLEALRGKDSLSIEEPIKPEPDESEPAEAEPVEAESVDSEAVGSETVKPEKPVEPDKETPAEAPAESAAEDEPETAAEPSVGLLSFLHLRRGNQENQPVETRPASLEAEPPIAVEMLQAAEPSDVTAILDLQPGAPHIVDYATPDAGLPVQKSLGTKALGHVMAWSGHDRELSPGPEPSQPAAEAVGQEPELEQAPAAEKPRHRLIEDSTVPHSVSVTPHIIDTDRAVQTGQALTGHRLGKDVVVLSAKHGTSPAEQQPELRPHSIKEDVRLPDASGRKRAATSHTLKNDVRVPAIRQAVAGATAVPTTHKHHRGPHVHPATLHHAGHTHKHHLHQSNTAPLPRAVEQHDGSHETARRGAASPAPVVPIFPPAAPATRRPASPGDDSLGAVTAPRLLRGSLVTGPAMPVLTTDQPPSAAMAGGPAESSARRVHLLGKGKAVSATTVVTASRGQVDGQDCDVVEVCEHVMCETSCLDVDGDRSAASSVNVEDDNASFAGFDDHDDADAVMVPSPLN